LQDSIMPLTRSERAAALNYVITVVMEEDVDGPLVRSLANANIEYVSELYSLAAIDIVNLTYAASDGTPTALGAGKRGLLVAFCAFIRYRATQPSPIGDDWLSITSKEFDDFRISAYFDGTIYGNTSIVNQGPAASAPSARVRDPIEEFKRGIKRDVSRFPIFKDEKQWDAWNRTTVAQAHAQDLAEVFDPKYVPNTTEDKALFLKKQDFVFGIFVATLLTDQGKDYVRTYATARDAQSIYRCICEHAVTSTKASLAAGDILSHITSCKLGEGGTWRGSTAGFILHWKDQVRLYDSQVGIAKRHSNEQKKVLLQNAVHPVKDLRAVKTTSDQFKTQMGQDLTYVQYYELLQSAAQTYDSQFVPKTSAPISESRHDPNEFGSDFNDGETEDYQPAVRLDERAGEMNQPYDYDAFDNYVIKANAHSSDTARPPGTMRQPDTTMAFSKWHLLSPDAQTIWNGLTVADKAIILDPRRDSGRSARPLDNLSPEAKQLWDTIPDEDKITNYQPAVRLDELAGADVRVIFVTCQHVDVHGIHDHQIVRVPIVSAGGVISTQRGPVIAIMHQYAYTEKGATIHSCSQLEWYKNDVNDKSIKVPGGLQRIQTDDGYIIPINFKSGLPYVKIRPYTDEEWATLPRVTLTNDVDWNSTVFDHTLHDDDTLFDFSTPGNLHLAPLGGETSTPISESRHDPNEFGSVINDGETEDYQLAVRLDERAGKMNQLYDYDAFKDYGHSGRPPDGYKSIQVQDDANILTTHWSSQQQVWKLLRPLLLRPFRFFPHDTVGIPYLEDV
jgi:hypothetical protein